ncbi:MAG TPA: pyridoxal-phosphate dependent enzyme [Ramlibacter sp.]|nr:pyridoxal-phosphate dependent enzyme [Ramlibacter sp.]
MNSPTTSAAHPTAKGMPSWNPLLEGLRCLRCGTLHPVSLQHAGCASCESEGHHVSLAASYRRSTHGGIHLPFEGAPSLGEGSTPSLDLPQLAKVAGIAKLTVKNESANPTGSHKDRMSAFGVAHALATGADTIVLASSGNAAISAAAYCQAADLTCEVASYDDMPESYVQELQRLGARRLSFRDNAARWQYVSARAQLPNVLALTNHKLPALGSAPLAVEAYKLIAAEIAQAGAIPDHILVPTSRGDLIWGIFRGFSELVESGHVDKIPRLWAVEPFPRLGRVLAGEPVHGTFAGTTAQFSTAGSTVTWLQLQATRESRGGAVDVDDGRARAARSALRQAGLLPELCSAATLAALHTLVDSGRIGPSEHAMLVLTASSRRDPSWPDETSSAPLFVTPSHGAST